MRNKLEITRSNDKSHGLQCISQSLPLLSPCPSHSPFTFCQRHRHRIRHAALAKYILPICNISIYADGALCVCAICQSYKGGQSTLLQQACCACAAGEINLIRNETQNKSGHKMAKKII